MLFSLFCRVSLFFVLEVPVGKDGMVVAHEERDVELLSFVGGSGVALYARSDVVRLFDIVRHKQYFCTVGMMGAGGVGLTLSGVYIPPRLSGVMLTDIVRGIGDVDIMFGDFNARHPVWSDGVDVTHYPSGDALLTFATEAGFRWVVAQANTYRDISVWDLTLYRVEFGFTYRYVDIAGLDHQAQVLRMEVVEPEDMVRSGIPWRRVDWDVLMNRMDGFIARDGDMNLDAVVELVGGIQHAPRRRRMPAWWMPELCAMRADVRRFCATGSHEDYVLARKVYRSALVAARNLDLGKAIASTNDPDIFRTINGLELRRTLPSMMDLDGTYTSDHAAISDMLAEQLGPTGDGGLRFLEPVPDMCDLSGDEVEVALTLCPKDTSPGLDLVTYPFIWWLRAGWPDHFDKMIALLIVNDHHSFHDGVAVLIQKTAKPRYDIVKSWRMITLLSTMAKLVERIMLLRLGKVLELGE